MACLADIAIVGVTLDLSHHAGSSILELDIEGPSDHNRGQTKRPSTCVCAVADATRVPQPERGVEVGGLCMSDTYTAPGPHRPAPSG